MTRPKTGGPGSKDDITSVLGDHWKTLFEVAVALDGLRPALPISSIVRDGKRVLRTTCPATSQRLSVMKELVEKR